MFSWKTRESAQEVFAVRLAIGTFLALGDPGVMGHGLRSYFVPSAASSRSNICANRSAGRMPSCAVLVPLHAATLQNYRRRCSGPLQACFGI